MARALFTPEPGEGSMFTIHEDLLKRRELTAAGGRAKVLQFPSREGNGAEKRKAEPVHRAHVIPFTAAHTNSGPLPAA